MKTSRLYVSRFTGPVALAAGLLVPQMGLPQVTNWVAYNDHRPGPTIPPHVSTPSSWGTAQRVGTLNMGAPSDTTGNMINFATGAEVPAILTFTRVGAPDDFGAVGRPVQNTTPMARLFYGICDLSNDGIVGVRAVPPNSSESYVVMTVSGLDPSKRYVFRGSVARNGGYGNRWSLASIAAASWTDAHIPGAGGPGILTGNNFPASGLRPGQAAFNSGANNEGAVVGWNDIQPFPDGTFYITNQQYTGAIPGGTASGPYGYALAAMMLAEVEIVAPAITAHPAASTTVEQNRPFTLTVTATGAPLNYQWYKEGVGEIAGATLSSYSVAQAQVADSGNYYVVVYNSLSRQTSSVAQVTVFADTTAPSVESIFSYPTVDAGGAATLDQIIIEFNEPVMPASVSSPSSYTVPGGGNPVSVIVTNERSVVLMLGTPLTPDTEYSVTLSGATDAVGNVAGSTSPSFHSW
ncbi:MAG TPA: Ig-like domain-containing protein, partial [Methylomirabilota bacterium]|nr:Ig-like domain-containing protein [Methylomirabilota bacterium]